MSISIVPFPILSITTGNQAAHTIMAFGLLSVENNNHLALASAPVTFPLAITEVNSAVCTEKKTAQGNDLEIPKALVSSKRFAHHEQPVPGDLLTSKSRASIQLGSKLWTGRRFSMTASDSRGSLINSRLRHLQCSFRVFGKIPPCGREFKHNSMTLDVIADERGPTHETQSFPQIKARDGRIIGTN